MFTNLKKGLLVIGAIATFALASCGGSKTLGIVHFDQTILGLEEKDLGVSIGIKKGDEETRTEINTALETITKSTRDTLMIEAVERSAKTITSEGISQAPYDKTKKDLVIGLECNYAPFNWTEIKANEYTYPIDGKSNEFADGYDVQLSILLAKAMDYNLIIKKMEWDALIPALQTGEINTVIAGMTDTEERRKSIDFTNPYYVSELVLIVDANGPLANSTSLEDFRGKKIVSQIETVTNDVIDTWVTQFGVIHMNPLQDFATCALSVSTGEADAMTAEYPVAQAIVKGNN